MYAIDTVKRRLSRNKVSFAMELQSVIHIVVPYDNKNFVMETLSVLSHIRILLSIGFHRKRLQKWI